MAGLINYLGEFVKHHPDTIAFSMHKKGNLTYQQLYEKSIKLAIYFKKKQLQPGEFIIIALPTSLECIIAYFACLAAGICLIPIYPPKNPYDTTRLKNVMAFTYAPFVLVEDGHLADHFDLGYPYALEPIESAIKNSDSLSMEGFIPYTWKETDLCLLQYSSGSTQQPKGVEILHGNLMASLKMMKEAMRLTPEDKGCSWLPPYHDMGLIGSIFLPAYVGFPMYMLNSKVFATRPLLWLETISQEKCSVTSAPNFAYDICAHRAASTKDLHLDLSCLRIAINASEFIRNSTLTRFIQAFSPYGFKTDALKPTYGLAESTLMVTYTNKEYVSYAFDRNSLHMGLATFCSAENLDAAVELVSCGRAINGVDIQVVDREQFTGRPPFHIGEIWVKSPSNAKGYFGNLEKTKKTFQQQIIFPDDLSGYIRTGDTGFLDSQGNLYITGRLKDYVKHHGLDIAAEEVEDIISHSLYLYGIEPSFRSAVLCLHQAGEEQIIILQEIHSSHNQNEVKQTIIAAIKKTFSIIPEKIIFTKRGKIPRTTSGKIKRHAALILYQSGVLDEIIL